MSMHSVEGLVADHVISSFPSDSSIHHLVIQTNESSHICYVDAFSVAGVM